MSRRSGIAAVLPLVLATVCAACGDAAATPPASTANAPSAAASPSPTDNGASAGPTASATPSAGQATGAPPVAGPVGPPPTVTLEVVASGLDGPLDIAVRPADPSVTYVVEQVGRVRRIRDGVVDDVPLLDIAERVSAGGERGLLGLAFHPDPADGRMFVYYTALDGTQTVSSFETGTAAIATPPTDETVLLRMPDEFGNHNGGGLAFGPDGYLYIATGDGGGAGDPLDSGRDLGSLLAKVLRIDVDAPGVDLPYAIPADNPFVAVDGARQEIWLTGLRNPWRIRFDRATGDLWIGDVGQGDWEEIDVARTGVGGLDYGWNVTEGFHCFRASSCATGGLTEPVAEYGHDVGCSVTGGTVYRGTSQPALAGWYVLADYCSGRFWVLDPSDDGPQDAVVAADSGRSISAIAEDGTGELLATDLGSGELLQVVATTD